MNPLETYLSKLAEIRSSGATVSYREHELLGRSLAPEEAQEVTHMARRIAALILLQPELDKNYEAVKASAISWSDLAATT